MAKKNSHPKQSTDQDQDLQTSISSLEARLARVNSKWRVFLRGVIGGLGRAIGATIVFAALATLVSALLYQTGLLPEFNTFIGEFLPQRER